MSSKPNDFKLGLFVLVGIGILVAAVITFGASKLFQRTTVEETYVKGSVAGLKEGAPVLLHGVPVGEVTRINFSWNVYHQAEPRYVVIQFEVGNNVPLVTPGRNYAKRVQEEVDKGLRARVKSQGLAGATVVSLEYVKPSEHKPLPVPWQPHHIYIPSAPGEMSQIISSLTTISGNLKNIDFEKIGAQVQQDLAAVNRVLTNVNQLDVKGLSDRANSLVASLEDVSGRLKAFVGNTNALAQVNLPAISSKASQLVTNANQLVTSLQSTSRELDRKVGNVDESALNAALENVRRASQELEQAVHRFREYPSGTILGRPPPRAQSVEPP